MVGIGTSPGKIILMGEHAVVYGKPAIALPFFSVGIKSTAKVIQEESKIESQCYTGLLRLADNEIPGIKRLVEETLKYLNKNEEISLKIESNIPPQRGLGSSASVSVSVVKSLFDLFDVALTKEVLSKLVFVAENIHHHNPSGLDATTIIEEQVVLFEKGKELQYLNTNMNGYLIVADSGEFGHTKESVANVQKNMKVNPLKTKESIDQLGILSTNAINDIEEGDLVSLGSHMTQAHKHLQDIGVSNNTLDNLVKTALQKEALGAKLTGGGNGGCIIALSDNMVDAKNIADALLGEGAKHTWIYHLKEI